MITVAMQATAKAAINRGIHLLRASAMADAVSTAPATHSGASQRQGNCMKRSSGKVRYKTRLGGNIMKVDAAASPASRRQSSGFSRRNRRVRTAAPAVTTINKSATHDRFRLKATPYKLL